jgi:hypothetical protein
LKTQKFTQNALNPYLNPESVIRIREIRTDFRRIREIRVLFLYPLANRIRRFSQPNPRIRESAELADSRNQWTKKRKRLPACQHAGHDAMAIFYRIARG